MTSRLFKKPVSVALKGGSSVGKVLCHKKVLDFFPQNAFYQPTSVSEKALIYSDEVVETSVHHFL